MKNILLIKLST